jgi:2-hydroxycyclohexanecarboxyl-CoA dehydrogenase
MGGSIARHLASEGACVALLDKDTGTVESVGQSLRPYEVKTLGMTVDLVNSEQVDDAFENVRATLGTPTILVNVLGGIVRFAEHKPLYNWTDAEWERAKDR